MKHIKSFNESIDFEYLATGFESIFLELRDRNIEVIVRVTKLYNKDFIPIKDEGITITIRSKDKIKLSDIMYDYIYTSMDYARANGIDFKAIRFDSSVKNMKEYFYEFMMGEEKDKSFNQCWLCFR